MYGQETCCKHLRQDQFCKNILKMATIKFFKQYNKVNCVKIFQEIVFNDTLG